MVKNLPASAGNMSSSLPGSGRPPGEGYSNPLQYSCLENPMDRKALWTIVQGVTKRIRHNLVTKQQQKFYSVYIHTAVFKMDNQEGLTI